MCVGSGSIPVHLHTGPTECYGGTQPTKFMIQVIRFGESSLAIMPAPSHANKVFSLFLASVTTIQFVNGLINKLASHK